MSSDNHLMIDSDQAALERAGKKEQLKREWGFFSILGFSATLLATWEATSALFGSAFLNGGPVSVVYGFIVSVLGTLAIGGSLAEMASITPISGAQYHWTAEHSPPRARAFLSWMQGWITLLTWQVALASGAFLTATMLQGLVIFNYSSYNPQRWHATLLMIAVSGVGCLANTLGKSLLPLLEIMSGILHVLFFFIIMIAMLVTSKKASNAFVWKNFVNGGGWPNDGVSFCIGFLTPAFALAGCESIVHMSEETRRASVNIPRAMISSIIINGICGFAFILTVLYSISDVDAVMVTKTGFPIIEVFFQATQNAHAATAMTCAVIFMFSLGLIAVLASTSRLTWAFARDRGLPFSNFFSHINPYYRAPVRAVLLNFFVTILLSLIEIGSVTAINALLSLATIAFYSSYLLPILLFLIRRFNGPSIEYGPWSMGRYGAAINVVAIAFCAFLIIFLPFPPILPVTAVNMNWAAPIFIAVMIFAISNWFVRGRFMFVGPIKEVATENSSEVVQVEVVAEKHS